jgi:hypothetical protein
VEGGLPPERGVRQQLAAQAFPEFFSGFYRVDAASPPAYLEFSLFVRGGAFEDGLLLHEVHFIVGGLGAAPADAPPGAAYVFLSRDELEPGGWRYFGYPLPQAFREAFGAVPPFWEALEITVALYAPGGVGGETRVYVDDLFVGPQRDNPNVPDD